MIAKFLQVLRKTWCDVEDFSCQLTMFQDQVLIKPLLFLASKKSFMHFHPKNIQSKLSEKKHRYFQDAILGTITLSHPVWQSGKMRKSMEILSHWWEMLVPWRVFNKKKHPNSSSIAAALDTKPKSKDSEEKLGKLRERFEKSPPPPP